MDQRLSLVTLGVKDLRTAVEFYSRLGWNPSNDWQTQDVAFYQCVGVVFALWNREELAKDSGTRANPPGAVTVAFNARSRQEVDAVIDEARNAGAYIHRVGAPTEWGGYSGVFHDLDGHAWEIAHNPHFQINDDGSILLP